MNVSHLIFFSYALWSSFINEKIIKNAINVEQRGRVISWEKHQKLAVQRELEAAIRGSRSLPKNNVGFVHNFQDILTAELDGYLPGSSYFRRRAHRKLSPVDKQPKNITQCMLNFIRRRKKRQSSFFRSSSIDDWISIYSNDFSNESSK